MHLKALAAALTLVTTLVILRDPNIQTAYDSGGPNINTQVVINSEYTLNNYLGGGSQGQAWA